VNGQDSQAEIFDVFLCHNSEDKPAVREIARRLVGEGIKPWLDEEEIRPGTSWQTAIAEQMKNIWSATVFLRENGLGPWQNEEIQGFLSRFVERKSPIIPVVLPYGKRRQSSLATAESSLCGFPCTRFTASSAAYLAHKGQKA
jgi:hypothetical protein